MHTLNSLTVYAASSTKISQTYIDAAARLGTILADHGIRLIYGAGAVGLMGSVADAVIEHGGRLTGVIPQFMVDQGWCHPVFKGAKQYPYDGESPDADVALVVTESMHERKAAICRWGDAMLALPGGIGTFEELTECLTWKQLGLHTKPVVILNTDGYYDDLLHCFNRMVSECFMRDLHRDMYRVVSSPEEVIDAILTCPQWDASIRKQAQL